MTTLQDRILEKFDKEFYYDDDYQFQGKSMITIKDFLIDSIAQVQEETRKETKYYLTPILNSYEMSSDGIDDDNKMLKELIKIVRLSLTTKEEENGK